MRGIKKLPDSEFEVMRVIWDNNPPMSTNEIIGGLGNEKNWKPQTVLTLLVRLIDRGFLSSEKVGKIRTYNPLVTEEDYLQAEAHNFISKYYKNSLTNLVNTLYAGDNLTEEDIDELKGWLKERE